jgi:hypothetical protein
VFSQEYVRRLNWIPVSNGEGLLTNIYSGGINNIEHQFIDIDGDGDFDILFLDSDKTFGWYENTGDSTTAEFDLSFTTIPGLVMSGWFYFVDIDNDDDYDLFTANDDKISFLENTGSTLSPSFQLVQDTVYADNGQPILSEFDSNPLFADIDADGDFDFFSGNSAGTVIYYENIGTTENFLLKHITNQWQGICLNCGFGDFRHGSSSIEFVDIDDDLDLDIFIGDLFSKSLYFIKNVGTKFIPNMDTSNIAATYPLNQDSIFTSGFNMPRFIDIDSDNDFDLFVSVLFDLTAPQNLIYYLNQGNPQTADHKKITDDYLSALDVRANSHPSFGDLDNDGNMDLLLGSLNNPLGTLHFLENTGSVTNPAFEYLDSSYFNIAEDLSVVPTLGDLDGNGTLDLLIGLFDGQTDYYRNEGTAESPDFVFQAKLTDNTGTVIDVGINASPLLFDVDGDVDLDLTIGGFNGEFKYYENTGNPFGFEFTPDELFYENLDVGDNSTPFLIDYNQDDIIDMFSGNRVGKLFYFKNNGSNQSPVWLEITDQFIEENFGGSTVPYFIDIDNDSDTDLFLGNVKGGLYLYENTTVSNIEREISELPESFLVTAHPNPFNPNVVINVYLGLKSRLNISIYNILGEKVKSMFFGELHTGIYSFNWNGTNESNQPLPSGNYIVIVQSEKHLGSLKLTLLK